MNTPARMIPDQTASLRAQYWREFMEEVLGIPPDTPLVDVLPSVIMKAAKPHYASILTEAAVKARSMATATQSTQLQAPQILVGPGHGYTRGYQPYSRPQPQVKSAVSPGFIRSRLEQTIFNMKLPSQLINYVRFTGHEGSTGSGNFRMDFSDWTFGEKGNPGPLPPTATNMLEALFRSISELEAIGVQIMHYTVPFMVRITFRSEHRGRLFDCALRVKTRGSQNQPRESNSLVWRRSMSPINMKIEHKHSSSSSNSGAPGSDQYPPRTSYQEAATALIDSYRPTPGDPGNQRLPSSHKADSRQNLEKYPAEALREQGRSRTGRENGRLSPVRDIEMESGLHTGVKRESDGSPAAKEDMQQLFLRPQSKRLRAADFMDVGDDHYP